MTGPLFGIGSVLAGLVVSAWVDVPSGPPIVVMAGLAFLAAWASSVRRGRRPPPRGDDRTGGAR